jgi:hypothetical protein
MKQSTKVRLIAGIPLWLVLVSTMRMAHSPLRGWIDLLAILGLALVVVCFSPEAGARRWTIGLVLLGLAYITAQGDVWPSAPDWFGDAVLAVTMGLAFLSMFVQSRPAMR